MPRGNEERAEVARRTPMSLCGISTDIEGERDFVLQAIRETIDEVQRDNPGLLLKVRIRVDAKYPKPTRATKRKGG